MMTKHPPPHVEVKHIHVRDAVGEPETRVVCASVFLDSLRPADAAVELTIEDETGRPAPSRPSRRMWSEQPYGEGTFLFVTRLPASDLDGASRLNVRVRPARRSTGDPGEQATGSCPL